MDLQLGRLEALNLLGSFPLKGHPKGYRREEWVSEMAARRTASSRLCRILLLRSQTSNQQGSRILHPGFRSSRHEIWNQHSTSITSPVRLNFISPMCTSAQKRASAKTTGDDNKITIGPKASELEKDGKESGVVYYGPISSTIKKVKLLSLSTCCLSVSLGPVITFMTSPDMNVILKGGVAATVIFLSASTTAALHWFVSPYIHKLKWKPGSETFDVEMMSWLATSIPKTIKFSDVRPAETNRPFVTFKADGNFYFVDAEHCHDKTLLAMLTPQQPAHESAFKNL